MKPTFSLILTAFFVASMLTSCNLSISQKQVDEADSIESDTTTAVQQTVEAPVKEYPNADLPNVNLTQKDGSIVKLSSLYGKYVYVDVWATWCGPCCMEIPHLERLVEKMSDQDKVAFVSISIDDDIDDWRQKINADQPEWPQFVILENDQERFCEALNVEYIPRFFIINPEGKIIEPDAKRPSDETLEADLRAL